MRPLANLALLMLLGGCATDSSPPLSAASDSSETFARQVISAAQRYCREDHYEPGTAHFDECVKNKAISDALEMRMLQIAANGAPAPFMPAAPVAVSQPVYLSPPPVPPRMVQ